MRDVDRGASLFAEDMIETRWRRVPGPSADARQHMPTNLPPQYFEVEKRYKAATEPQEKAQLLEELLGTIPKHKGTDHLRADLRRKLSKLKAAAYRAPR